MPEPSATDRDRALRRLRRTTSVALAAAGALVAAFAGLAARALPGHQSVKTTGTSVRATHRRVPPPLVPAQSAAAPAAPASPPAQTQAPPVVVSGGT
jgi:hypothetical protein